MIHAIVSVAEQNYIYGSSSNVVVSAFSECFQILSQPKGKKSSSPIQDHIKHAYSDESICGLLVGDYGERTIFCSHSGSAKECDEFAKTYLFSSADTSLDQFVLKSEEYLKESVSFPYLMVMIEGSRILAITSYSEDDFDITALQEGTYCIK